MTGAVGPLESQQNKGVASGYASLDGTGNVPALQLENVTPAGVGAAATANNGSDFADKGSTRYNIHDPELTPAAAVAGAPA